jgi:Secretion system C-terminal sorting domain
MSILTQSYLIQINPDPFINYLSVIAKSEASESASINIYNEYGNAVHRSELDLNPGINSTEIELEDCPPGVYYLHFKTPVSKLFVIRRLEKIEDSVKHN